MRDEPLIPTRSREQISADNRAELDAWISERTAELVARGMPRDRARDIAIGEFGNVADAQQYAEHEDMAADQRTRARLWIEEFGADVRIGLRGLRRTPLITAVVLLTFAVGVGATTAVFSVVHAMLMRELPYGDSDALVQLPGVNNGVLRATGQLSTATLFALRERAPSFSGVAAMGYLGLIAQHGDTPELITAARLTSNAFEVLKAPAALGRTFEVRGDSGAAAPVAVISHGLWRRVFGGDSSIIGKTVQFSGVSREIIGVMPPDFRLPTMEDSEMWVPIDLGPVLRDVNRAQKFRFLRVFARMKPGVTLAAAQSDLDRTIRGLQTEFPQSFTGLDAKVMPVRTAIAGASRPRLLMLMGAAGFVLLIACANVAGILLSRAMSRRHELSVRIALGAGRRRLIRQFLGEGVAIAMLGGVAGVVVAQLGIIALRRIAVNALPPGTEFQLEPRVLAFAVGVTIAGAIMASLVPAVVATRAPGVALRDENGRTSLSRANRRIRLGLVTGQLAVSVVLLVGAGLFLRTLHTLSTLDLGYDTDRTLTFQLSLPAARYTSNAMEDAFWSSLYREIGAMSGVTHVAAAGNIPMGGTSSASLAIERHPVEGPKLPEVKYATVSDDFFATLGIPFVRGRTFNSADRDSSPPVVIISAAAAKKFWPGEDPIGAHVRLGPDPSQPWITVVGIVGDVYTSAADAPEPAAYVSQRQDHWRGGSVVVRASGDPHALMNGVREAVKRVDPAMPVVEMQTLEEFRQRTRVLSDRRMQLQLMAGFAIIALLVSAIGVYGVSAYATEARRREFGIRMALGASKRGVLWLALREGAVVAMIGAAIGVPLSWLLATRLRDLLFQVSPVDLTTTGIVVVTLLVVAFGASLIPARRATMIDPARTMRND